MDDEALRVTDRIGAEGAIAARITLDWMKTQIDQYHIFTLDECFLGMGIKAALDDVSQDDSITVYKQDLGPRSWATEIAEKTKHVTVCVMRLKNGFVVIGKTASLRSENYEPSKAATFAYEDCIRQLWPMFAFAQLQHEYTRNLFVEAESSKVSLLAEQRLAAAEKKIFDHDRVLLLQQKLNKSTEQIVELLDSKLEQLNRLLMQVLSSREPITPCPPSTPEPSSTDAQSDTAPDSLIGDPSMGRPF